MRIVVIGGGIAGVSVAYWLAVDPSRPEVVLVEAEGELAAHTTGRSAAQYIRNLGSASAMSLTSASHDFYTNPPAEFCHQPLLHPRGTLTVADSAHEADFESSLVDGQAHDPTIAEISLAEAVELFPPLRPERFVRACLEPNSTDIDVAELHQTFVRGLRANGGTIKTGYRVDAVTRPDTGKGWVVEAGDRLVTADLVVNAAGAWGDLVAARAGVAPVGLQPLRRTAFMVSHDAPGQGAWPLVASVEHSWYVKPDGPQLLCSPANEDPMEPCDVKPEELDVAIAIERINEATTLGIRSVQTVWAGLRTFVADRSMVLGPDPDQPDFIWCVGQGGTGIQTAPATGRYVAELTIHGEAQPWVAEYGLESASVSPDRLRA